MKFFGTGLVAFVAALFSLGCSDVAKSPTSPTAITCSYVFSPAKVVTSSLSQRVIVQVKTGDSCPWVATTVSPWIDIAYQGSNGTGDLIFNLDRNQCRSGARTGFFFIKGSENFLEVVQDGSDLGLCP